LNQNAIYLLTYLLFGHTVVGLPTQSSVRLYRLLLACLEADMVSSEFCFAAASSHCSVVFCLRKTHLRYFKTSTGRTCCAIYAL